MQRRQQLTVQRHLRRDRFDAEPPPCGKGKTKVHSPAELLAWLAEPTTDLEIADDPEFSGADLVIATRCDVQVKSKAAMTGLSNVRIAATTVDFGGAAVVAGRFELRAVHKVTVWRQSKIMAESHVIEAWKVDEGGDVAVSFKTRIESSSDAAVRHNARSCTAGATVEVWAGGSLDVGGDFEGPGSVFLSTGEKVNLREDSTIADTAGSVTLQAGTDQDARGRILNAGGAVSMTAGSDVDFKDDARVVNVAGATFP